MPWIKPEYRSCLCPDLMARYSHHDRDMLISRIGDLEEETERWRIFNGWSSVCLPAKAVLSLLRLRALAGVDLTWDDLIEHLKVLREEAKG